MPENRFHFQRMMCAGRDQIVERIHLRAKDAPKCPEKYRKLGVPRSIRNDDEDAPPIQVQRCKGSFTEAIDFFFHFLTRNCVIPDDHNFPKLSRFQRGTRSS